MKKNTGIVSNGLLTLSLLATLVPASLMSYFPFNEKAYQYMDQQALESNTDKSSRHHNYTKVYSQWFDSIKNKPIKFLEIGVFRGESVKLWEKYFSKADLHFIDINYNLLTYLPTRATLHTADQGDPNQLIALMQKTGGNFDVILDDGGHTMHQQKTSFATLFPYVKSGGLYIIEDLHTSYWSGPDGNWFINLNGLNDVHNDHQSAVELLKHLIDHVNYVGARTGKADHDKNMDAIRAELNIYREQILSMTFYDSVCIIVKR